MPDVLLEQLQQSLGSAYTIERELGGGGMARVFVAEETRFRRRVAIKVLSPELAHGLSVERFEREIVLAAALQQAHIVPVITAGVVDGLPWYSMPYVDGESLRARMNNGPVPLDEAATILADVARALAYAHAQGVVHRDIKPENVLLSGGSAVVTDFGIAKAVSVSRTQAPGGTLTVVGTSLGTPAYMAPEQAAGDEVDARADIYAWGVMAYELLAGRHPFAGRATAQQLIAAQIAESPPPLRSVCNTVPERVAALVDRTLAKRPDERPSSAAELVRALEDRHSVESSTVAARPATRSIIRDARLWSVAAISIVLIAGGTLWQLRRHAASSTISVPAADASNISTLAVLPFVNIGGDPKDEYFSDGMTDELAHSLETLPGLKLAGRTSSYAFKGKNVSATQIGRTLDVAGLVEGTVQRSGNRLRVSAQLTSAIDGKVRWSDTYERPAGDVFTVQDELTSAIVAALAPALRGERAGNVASESRGTTNAAAYDLYLRGQYFWSKRGAGNLARAADYFRKAIAADPGFARAQAGLSMTYGVLPFYVDDPADSFPALALRYAAQAIALDSTLTDAHTAMANALSDNGRYTDAEAEYDRTLALAPGNATAHQWHGDNLLALGKGSEAVSEMRKAVELDPLSVPAHTDLGVALFDTRDFRDAIPVARRAIELGGDYVNGLVGAAYLFAGHPDSALIFGQRGARVTPDDPQTRLQLPLIYAANGRRDLIAQLRADVERDPRSARAELLAAMIALAEGDRAPMLRALQTPAGRHAWWFTYYSLGCAPVLDPIANEPAYLALLRQEHVARCSGSSPWPIKSSP
ncbi:MAG TPA: protein kinase [Gemmatimonadaceae bacterium]|nr:protein kinase [Gemmatimonadaceae bacterium]